MKRLLLSAFLLGVVTCCLTACELTPEKPKADNAILGTLVDIRNIDVFLDAGLESGVSYKPSHALVIGNSQPYRLLLVDGRLGWADRVSMLKVSALDEINISSLTAARLSADPIHPESGMGSGPINYSLSSSAKIVAADEQRYSETPKYILDQGRRIFLDDPQGFFYWPLLKIQDQKTSGWTSATGLVFRLADPRPLDMTGLIQKPFLILQAGDDALTFTMPQSFTYLDISDSSTATLSLDQGLTWSTEQVLVPSRDLDTGISSIKLVSAANNCNLFFVEWRSHKKMQFGYCKHKEAGPTPLIVGYRPGSNSQSLSLDIMEVFGDEDSSITINVSNQFNGKESIVVDHNTTYP